MKELIEYMPKYNGVSFFQETDNDDDFIVDSRQLWKELGSKRQFTD